MTNGDCRNDQMKSEVADEPLMELVLKMATESAELNIQEDLREILEVLPEKEESFVTEESVINAEDLTRVAEVLRLQKQTKKNGDHFREDEDSGRDRLLSGSDIVITPNHVGFRDLMNATRFWKATQMMGTRKELLQMTPPNSHPQLRRYRRRL